MVIVIESTGLPRTDFDIVRYKRCDFVKDDKAYINNLIKVATYMHKNNLDKLFDDFEDSHGTHRTDFYGEKDLHFAVYFSEAKIWKRYVAYGKEFLDLVPDPPSYVLKDIIKYGKCLLEVSFATRQR